MTDTSEDPLRHGLERIASNTSDPAARLDQVRTRARAIRRRRTTTAVGSLAVLASAASLSASALTGVLPIPTDGVTPAVLTPASSPAAAPTGSTSPPPRVPSTTSRPTRPSGSSGRSAQPSLPLVPAVSAAAVLDTVGVTVNLDNGSADVVERLQAVGIRHVRTFALPLYSDRARCDDPALLRRRALTDAGIRLTLTVGITANLAELRPTVRCLGGPGSVAAFEGANEPDRYVQGDWVAQTKAGQQALYQAVHADPELAGIPVLAPTPSTSAALGSVARYADLANAHPFQASYATLETALGRARTVAPGKPMVVTDLGWSNATALPAGRAVAVPASEQEVAADLPRVLLDNARRGIVRTYVYSLSDDRDDPARTDLEAGFGLLRHDGTPKPAYTALTALTATLEGGGGGASGTSPGQLAYSLDGRTDGVGQLLMRRTDGTFVLALWGTGGDRTVRLTLAAPSRIQLVQIGAPVGRSPAEAVQHLDVRVGSRPLMLEISP